MSGVAYLVQQGASRHQGERQLAWLKLASNITDLSFNLVNQSLKDSKKNLQIKKTKFNDQFQANVALGDKTIQFDFSIISKQFMEGVNKLILNELALRNTIEREGFLIELNYQFNYPIAMIQSLDVALTEFEKRQLGSGLVIFRFEEGISAISGFGDPNTFLKSGAVSAFVTYPTSLLLIASFALFVLTLLMSLLLIRPLEKRFSMFSDQVDLIKLGNKNIFNRVNIRQPGNDELSTLSIKVDDMAKRIIQYAEEQQQMTRSVSHEIRTPIVKMNYRLARFNQDNMNESELKNFNGLKTNMAELDSLVDELLLYSSLDKMPSPELVCINLYQFLQDQIKPLQNLACADIHLKTIKNTDTDTDTDVLSFAPYLSRIMQNLLTNAQRYAQQNIWVSFIVTQTGFTIVVEDDGSGISKELASKIFEPFVVDDESRNSALNGHGLGLSIVNKMVSALSGEIEVLSSERLGGACFVLTFNEKSDPVDVSNISKT
ncbi:two-component system, OmpR family, sensor histidine kinase RstB [Marinicellulosiphila megalodicopiae]